MAFQKGRERTGGRQKGVPNKTTGAAKQAFQYAFDKIGGENNLALWARKNQSDFYKLYARLIPQEQDITYSDGAVATDRDNTAEEWISLIKNYDRISEKCPDEFPPLHSIFPNKFKPS